MEELEKIDIIRERTGLSYRDTKELLDKAEGDLVKALIMAEEDHSLNWTGKLWDKGGDVLEQVKGYINKSNRTRIKLKKGDKTVAEFPATAGVVGVLAALASSELAILAGIGAVAAVAKNVSLEIQKEDGETKVISLDMDKKGKKTEQDEKSDDKHQPQEESSEDIDF